MSEKKKRIVLEQHEWGDADLDTIQAMMDGDGVLKAETPLRAYLNDHPDDMRALFLMGRVYLSSERFAEARVLYEYLRHTYPAKIEVLLNLAKAYDLLLWWETSAKLYQEVLMADPDNLKALLGLSTCAVQEHDPERALYWSDRALAVDPTAVQALSNRGFAYLQQREFEAGWRHYEYGVGHLKWRHQISYIGEPRWQGETGKDVNLIIHTEQGIGDQIAGVEPLHEAIRDCNVLALDCDPKLKALFRRSFPQIPYVGREAIVRAIESGAITPTHTGGIFSLHTHYRKREQDYSKRPYLVANPGLRAMYRGWLDALGSGLKVGLALSGGHTLTHKAARRVPLDALLPILRQPHTFVSLEYLDRRSEFADFLGRKGITIHTNPHIEMNLNFEEPAALIAELDLVIGVPTTAMHAAGALGTPAFCMVHSTPNIHYCNAGEQMPYYNSVRLFRRQNDNRWTDTVRDVLAAFNDFQRVEEAA